MTSNYRWIIVGASIAFSAVAIGAFAAHGLKHVLTQYQLGIVDTGAKYQMYHALAILLSVNLFKSNVRALNAVNSCFTAGVLLFSGSLYALAVSGIKIFAYFTPVGGLLFLIAWLAVIFFAYQRGQQEKSS